MIQNLVFDLGNVLVEFCPDEYMKRLGFDSQKAKKLEEIIFKDPRWNEFDRGAIVLENYVRDLKKENPQYAEDLDCIFQKDWVSSLFLPKVESIEFLKEASKTYNIYILSNVSQVVLDYIKTLDFWKFVTSGTYSYLLKSCKPEEKIYTTFLEENGLRPEECFFMDDKPENIQAAKALKMEGIVFKDTVLAEIRKRFLSKE